MSDCVAGSRAAWLLGKLVWPQAELSKALTVSAARELTLMLSDLADHVRGCWVLLWALVL